MNQAYTGCRCTLTLKVFVGGVFLYLLISCSLMIPSFRQYTSFQSEYDALTKTNPQVYQCYQICNNVYRFFSEPNLCCNDHFAPLCLTKDECKISKLEDLKNKQNSAVFDIEVGIGITLFCLIVLTIVFSKKYAFLVRQEMEQGQLWGNQFNDQVNGNINSSFLKQTRSSRVYKSFEDDENTQDLCVICYQSLSKERMIKLDCCHIFHRDCIRQWLQKKNHCPMCRAFA